MTTIFTVTAMRTTNITYRVFLTYTAKLRGRRTAKNICGPLDLTSLSYGPFYYETRKIKLNCNPYENKEALFYPTNIVCSFLSDLRYEVASSVAGLRAHWSISGTGQTTNSGNKNDDPVFTHHRSQHYT